MTDQKITTSQDILDQHYEEVEALQRENARRLSNCPKCGGPADNGHDREDPPNPYICTRCSQQPITKEA